MKRLLTWKLFCAAAGLLVAFAWSGAVAQTAGPMDYGDAPFPYPTLLSSNGARHAIVSGIMLGPAISADQDGQPDPSAALDSGDDGVIFASPLVPGNSALIRVFASVNGRLDAWIDFNANG